MEFELLEQDHEDNIVIQNYKGVCIIVGNGYLSWPSNIPPFSDPVKIWDHAFLEWLKSVRKDVKCTFGIMKGRFWQLKTGTWVNGHVATDRIWLK